MGNGLRTRAEQPRKAPAKARLIANLTGMAEPSPRTILFLCTGNYYRSRFAEALFNILAGHAPDLYEAMSLQEGEVPDVTRATHPGLNWRADSAGLRAHDYGHCNIGPLSPDAYRALFDRRIDHRPFLRMPRQVTEDELQAVANRGRIIALKESEHRPMMRETFPRWENRIEYWEVHDVPPSAGYDPMAEVDRHVRELLSQLAAEPDD